MIYYRVWLFWLIKDIIHIYELEWMKKLNGLLCYMKRIVYLIWFHQIQVCYFTHLLVNVIKCLLSTCERIHRLQNVKLITFWFLVSILSHESRIVLFSIKKEFVLLYIYLLSWFWSKGFTRKELLHLECFIE